MVLRIRKCVINMKSWNEHRFTYWDIEIHCHCSQPHHLRQVSDIQQTSLLLGVLLLAATRCHLHSLGEDRFLVAVSSVSGLIWTDICATPNPCCGVQNSSSWSLGIRKLGATLRNPALPKVRATHSLWEGASHQCSRGWGGWGEGVGCVCHAFGLLHQNPVARLVLAGRWSLFLLRQPQHVAWHHRDRSGWYGPKRKPKCRRSGSQVEWWNSLLQRPLWNLAVRGGPGSLLFFTGSNKWTSATPQSPQVSRSGSWHEGAEPPWTWAQDYCRCLIEHNWLAKENFCHEELLLQDVGCRLKKRQ